MQKEGKKGARSPRKRCKREKSRSKLRTGEKTVHPVPVGEVRGEGRDVGAANREGPSSSLCTGGKKD